MKVTLPVSMFPLTKRAASSGGLVLFVLIGLAAFMAAKAQKPSSSKEKV